MTEEQIIERIRITVDRAELDQYLRSIRQTRDNLQAERSAQTQTTLDWCNSSSLFSGEDFEAEMNMLSPTLDRYDEMLAKLGRIEGAVIDRVKALES